MASMAFLCLSMNILTLPGTEIGCLGAFFQCRHETGKDEQTFPAGDAIAASLLNAN